jgi:ribosomal protein L14E/L6E/L27E
VNVTDKTQVKVPLDLAGVHKHAQPAAKTPLERSHKGRAKKEKHVAGPEIQAKKIRQVSLTANAGKISRWAARETARQAREKAAYLAELEAVVAGARRKELERNQRTAGEQNPEAGNTAAALRRRDRTATKYRGVGFADDTQSQRQIGN